jgi:hypothetical protein
MTRKTGRKYNRNRMLLKTINLDEEGFNSGNWFLVLGSLGFGI